MGRRHRALADDDFWDLIAVLDGQVDDDATHRLADALRARGAMVARAFQERLAAALYELDREVLACQLVRWVDDDPDDEPIPLSDDAFLYLRAAVVARGRDVYREILTNPHAVLRYTWDDGEGLLYVAEEVVGDDIDTELSYETGANEQHWTPREDGPPPWGDGPCPVVVEIRDLSCPLTMTTVRVAEEAPAGADPAEQTLYPPPSYLRHDLPTDLSTSLAQILLDASDVPDDVDAPTIHVTVDVGDTQQTVPRVGAPMERPDLAMISDDETVRVRPVEVAVPDTALRSLSPDARESTITGLVAACVLAVLPEHHGARAALEALRAEGAVHLG